MWLCGTNMTVTQGRKLKTNVCCCGSYTFACPTLPAQLWSLHIYVLQFTHSLVSTLLIGPVTQLWSLHICLPHFTHPFVISAHFLGPLYPHIYGFYAFAFPTLPTQLWSLHICLPHFTHTFVVSTHLLSSLYPPICDLYTFAFLTLPTHLWSLHIFLVHFTHTFMVSTHLLSPLYPPSCDLYTYACPTLPTHLWSLHIFLVQFTYTFSFPTLPTHLWFLLYTSSCFSLAAVHIYLRTAAAVTDSDFRCKRLILALQGRAKCTLGPLLTNLCGVK